MIGNTIADIGSDDPRHPLSRPSGLLLLEQWEQDRSPRWRRMLVYKRVMDIAIAALVLMLSLPILLLIAIAIRVESRGPILFCQQRFGRVPKLINVYKFRTMYADVTDQTGQKQTRKYDPRVTRIGRFLRAHSIDEVPQFFNVLIGTMSLVGPRPMPIGMTVAGQAMATVANWNLRYEVKPGLTGLAQINGSRGAMHTLAEAKTRLEYDLAYIETWSLRLDWQIIIRTLVLCFHDKEAY